MCTFYMLVESYMRLPMVVSCIYKNRIFCTFRIFASIVTLSSVLFQNVVKFHGNLFVRLYLFCIVCTLCVWTRNILMSFQLASCIGFVQFVHCLFIQKTRFNFQAGFSLNFVQVLHSLYIFCIYVRILIVQSLYTKYTQIQCFV